MKRKQRAWYEGFEPVPKFKRFDWVEWHQPQMKAPYPKMWVESSGLFIYGERIIKACFLNSQEPGRWVFEKELVLIRRGDDPVVQAWVRREMANEIYACGLAKEWEWGKHEQS